MKYTREDYISDCKNSDMLHIKDKERFKAFYEELGNDPIQKKQKVILNRIKFIEPYGKIIELGCHIGFNCEYFAKMGFNITGVDISKTLIDEAIKNLEELPINVKNNINYINSDILDLDDKNKFDTIILTETLEHVIDPIPILQKSKQILNDGGKIYVSAPSKRIGTYSHVRGISKVYLLGICKELDLSVNFFENNDENTYAVLSKIK